MEFLLKPAQNFACMRVGDLWVQETLPVGQGVRSSVPFPVTGWGTDCDSDRRASSGSASLGRACRWPLPLAHQGTLTLRNGSREGKKQWGHGGIVAGDARSPGQTRSPRPGRLDRAPVGGGHRGCPWSGPPAYRQAGRTPGRQDPAVSWTPARRVVDTRGAGEESVQEAYTLCRHSFTSGALEPPAARRTLIVVR